MSLDDSQYDESDVDDEAAAAAHDMYINRTLREVDDVFNLNLDQ